MRQRPSTQEDFLRWQFADNGVVELRHLDGKRAVSGVFDSIEALQAAIAKHTGSGNAYLSLNRPTTTTTVANAMGARALGNADIETVTRLPFDFDPERPSGVAATDGELSDALKRRDGLVAMLRKIGWPQPLTATSGNGAHAVYRVRLPNTGETAEQLRAIYRGLASEVGDDVVAFDTTVRNPGRIWRLYDTTNRKGTTTAERPHRVARCWIPRTWSRVAAQQVEALADHYARQNTRTRPLERRSDVVVLTGSGDYSTLDVVVWMQTHGLYLRHIEGNKHAITCPWADEHSTQSRNDTIVYEGDGGWPGFFCHHDHCADRRIGDLIEVLGDADAYCTAPFRRGSQA